MTRVLANRLPGLERRPKCLRRRELDTCSAAAGWVPVFTSGMAPSHDRSRCRLTAVTLQPARVLVGTSGYNYPGVARDASIRRSSAPTRCSPTTPSGSRPSRSTTRSTGCPTEKLLAGWSAARPTASPSRSRRRGASRTTAKLQRCEDAAPERSAGPRATLGPKLATLLFQLPPTFKKDAAVLRGVRRRCCRDGTRAAFEFRHASWLDAEVFDVLREPQRRAVHRRQREDEHAGRDHRRLRVLPAARRGVSAGRHRTLGLHDRDAARRAAMCSSISSTRSRASGRSSRAALSRRWGPLIDTDNPG